MHWQRITEKESELRQRHNRRKNTCSLWASQWFNHESLGMTKTTSPYSELISDRCEKMVTARLEREPSAGGERPNAAQSEDSPIRTT